MILLRFTWTLCVKGTTTGLKSPLTTIVRNEHINAASVAGDTAHCLVQSECLIVANEVRPWKISLVICWKLAPFFIWQYTASVLTAKSCEENSAATPTIVRAGMYTHRYRQKPVPETSASPLLRSDMR